MRSYAFSPVLSRLPAPLYFGMGETYADPGFEGLAVRLKNLLDATRPDSEAVRLPTIARDELDYGPNLFRCQTAIEVGESSIERSSAPCRSDVSFVPSPRAFFSGADHSGRSF